MLRTILAVSAIVLLSSCAALQGSGAQQAAANAVNKYCQSFTYDVRAAIIRPEFDALIAPNKARVWCYGDPENPRVEAPNANTN